MPRVEPFKAVRYRQDVDLALVTAPPYDVISEDERSELERKHPLNVIRLTLGPPSSETGLARYEKAGLTFRNWLSEEVLIEDEEPSAYLYRFETREGRASAGFVLTVKLEELGAGGILPHEKTMPAPKVDRLELMRATDANLEALWFVASEDSGMTENVLSKVEGTRPMAEVRDPDEVKHTLWRLEEDSIEHVTRSLGKSTLVIADGHHRYETAITYRKEMSPGSGAGPWDYTLAFIQEPGSLGPSLNPIHRIVRGVEVNTLKGQVELTPFEGNLRRLAEEVADRGPGTIGLWNADQPSLLQIEAELDTEWLQSLVEEAGAQVFYEHDLSGVEKAMGADTFAFILAPIPVGLVAEKAVRGERMPPKTTLFWPKPLSGLLMRDISGPQVGGQLS
jgi:uncharacterized protein (DUF1015 family)